MSSTPHYEVANNLQTALNAGMSESTVQAQHIKAIAVLTARVPVDATESAAITAALAELNLQLAHIKAPGTKGGA